MYSIVKINPSDAVFVFEGRIYYKLRENKDYLKTREDIVAFMGKIGDFSTFVYKITSFKSKLVKIRDNLQATSSDSMCEYLSSSDVEEMQKIIGSKSDYIKTKINIKLLTENLTDLQNVIKYIEKYGSDGTVFSSMMASGLNTLMEKFRKKDATTVLNETIDALEKISAN